MREKRTQKERMRKEGNVTPLVSVCCLCGTDCLPEGFSFRHFRHFMSIKTVYTYYPHGATNTNKTQKLCANYSHVSDFHSHTSSCPSVDEPNASHSPVLLTATVSTLCCEMLQTGGETQTQDRRTTLDTHRHTNRRGLYWGVVLLFKLNS